MSSPLSDQILNLCESELFPDVENTEVASSSNCYAEHSSYSNNLDMNKFIKNEEGEEMISPSTTRNGNDNNNINSNDLTIIFDLEGDSNFSVPNFLHPQQELFNIDTLNNQPDHGGARQYPPDPLMGPPLGHIYEEEALSSVPPYIRLPNSSSLSCSLVDPTLANFTMPAGGGSLFYGAAQDMEFQADTGRMFCPDALPRVFNDLQALSNESQQLVGCSNPLPLDINSEDNSYKTVKYSPEVRREKIHRYMKKRNERNFSKKIKYACRKTLADSRPRVRGRFAKNDEFGEASKPSNTHEEDVKLNLIYHHDPNMITPSVNDNHNARIFTSNCHTSNNPYDICTPLYCTDGQLH